MGSQVERQLLLCRQLDPLGTLLECWGCCLEQQTGIKAAPLAVQDTVYGLRRYCGPGILVTLKKVGRAETLIHSRSIGCT
jgi:hypothetical protein